MFDENYTALSQSIATPKSLAWTAKASELARWTRETLVNRCDVWGIYLPIESRRRGRSAITERGQLTEDIIARHYRGADPGHLIGLHSTSAGNTSRWFAIDVDKHDGDDADSKTNFSAALYWYGRLSELGFHPLLIDSNGAGGFHLLVIFDEPAPTQRVYTFAQSLIADWKELGLRRMPETFPKQPKLTGQSVGNWLRLPGRHHTRDRYSRVWVGDGWAENEDAVQRLLDAELSSPSQIPAGLLNEQGSTRPSATTRRNGTTKPAPPGWLARSTADFIANGATPGTRNDRLFRAAVDLAGNGYSEQQILERVGPAAVQCGLEDDEIRRTVRSAISQPRAPSVTVDHTSLGALALRYEPFPVDVLPDVVKRSVDEGAEAIGCDPAYIALPMFATLAAAIGNKRRIQLKPTWHEPSVVWAVIVGESGTLKSPALDLVLRPVYERQREALHRYELESRRCEAELKRYDTRMAKGRRRDANGNGEGVPNEPVVPVPERVVCVDHTVEALVSLFPNSPRGLLLARDELAGWLNSFNIYRNGRGGDVAHYLTMFGARDLVFDRKTGEQRIICVPRAALSIAGGIQPGALRRALGRARFEEGLVARCLFAMPPNPSRVWTDKTIKEETFAAVMSLYDALYGLQLDIDGRGGPVPLDLALSALAKEIWVDFYNAHAAEQAELGGGDLKAAWSKLECYAARLALITHVVRSVSESRSREPNATLIDQESMRAGIALTRWFSREVRRVYAVLGESAAQRMHRRVVEYIVSKGGRMTVRDLQRASIDGLRTVRDVVVCVETLVADGYVEWATPRAGRPRNGGDMFRLIGHPTPDTDR